MGYILFITISVFAQQISKNNISKIESDSLPAAYSKTTNIDYIKNTKKRDQKE